MVTRHIFEYHGGHVPRFGPFVKGQRVTIPLTHPLFRTCIDGNRHGSWKEVGRVSGDGRSPDAPPKSDLVGVPTFEQVKAAGYSDDAAHHIVRVRKRMAELVADGLGLADAERKAEAEIGALPSPEPKKPDAGDGDTGTADGPKEIKRPAPDAPPASERAEATDDSDDSDDSDDDSEQGAVPGVAEKLAKAMKKAAIVRLGKGIGAKFRANAKELTIARAIVDKLGGDEAAMENPTVAAALARTDA